MVPSEIEAARRSHIEELAARVRGGDRATLDDLLVAIRPDVLAQCGRFLPNRQDAEEACQDALLAVARTITNFEGRSTFRTWLHSVTANCCLATYRALKRRTSRTVAGSPTETRPDRRTTSVIAGSRLDLLDALERMEESHPHLVAAVVLRDISGLEYAEIAEELAIPIGTVRSRIHDGRSHLRRHLRVEP